jgi:hypothetical protein
MSFSLICRYDFGGEFGFVFSSVCFLSVLNAALTTKLAFACRLDFKSTEKDTSAPVALRRRSFANRGCDNRL